MTLSTHERIDKAVELMTSFAERTGLSGDGAERRYLWTDAFAVCNLLGLSRLTNDKHHRAMALELVDQVHHTLGCHRPDDARTGWLSGLSATEGELHPTRGGLRIGKALPERGEAEPYDRELEWDRDGQYFHYLTQWMHALNQASSATAQPILNLWARELAQTVFVRFREASLDHRHLAWKLSIDLSRPLVSSMGQHDALDGFATFAELRQVAYSFTPHPAGPGLERELEGLARLLDSSTWETIDPLGLGGVLVDALRVVPLVQRDILPDDRLLCALLAVALEGLDYSSELGEFQGPAAHRLAFRELGLAIGLSALERLEAEMRRGGSRPSPDLGRLLESLRPYTGLGRALEDFWLDRAHESTPLWSEHRDINEVMLATRLAPEGFLAGARAA